MSEKLDIYKAKGFLGDLISCVPISNSAMKYSETCNSMQNRNTTAASEAQASISNTSINPIRNSTIADELTDIDMIVCGSPLRIEMSAEDDEDSTMISGV